MRLFSVLAIVTATRAFVTPIRAGVPLGRPATTRFARLAGVAAAAAAEDFYVVLGLETTASKVDVKRAYRLAALRCHPDVNKAPDAQAAYIRVVRRRQPKATTRRHQPAH